MLQPLANGSCPMENVAITLNDVSLQLPVYGFSDLRIVSSTTQRMKSIFSKKEDMQKLPHGKKFIQAVNGVSIKIESGDRLALIGVNGSGKSSLLKILAGIYEPTAGTILTEGKVVTLLENNSSFLEEATAKENLKLISILQGWSSVEHRHALEFVNEFTELGLHLDLPIRTYSDGMISRLGLSFALLNKPQILLIDENLGAGDEKFQSKITKYLDQFFDGVDLLVMASHSREILEKLCNKGCVMEGGAITHSGPLDTALEFYENI